jgi:hypothetical protein
LIPGVNATRGDLGGSQGVTVPALSIHGGNEQEMSLNLDGMKTNSILLAGGGNRGGWVMNTAMVEEFAINTSSAGAESETGGVQVNIIPKQGGNRFTGFFLLNYMNDSMQMGNLDDELRARGASSGAVTKKIYDVNPAFGGPIQVNKMWFFGSYRSFGTVLQPPGAFHDSNPEDFVFTPDLSRPVEQGLTAWTANLRVTRQLNTNNKLAVYGDYVVRDWCCRGVSATVSPDATGNSPFKPKVLQGLWNWTASNRLFIEAGQSYRPEVFDSVPQPGIPPDRSGVQETRTNSWFRAPTGAVGTMTGAENWQTNGTLAVTYLRGAHTLKFGSQWITGRITRWDITNNDHWYVTLDGVPQAVVYRSTPVTAQTNVKANIGIYVQDQWRVSRLTVNAGVRFDYLNAYIPVQSQPATRFASALEIDEPIKNLPNWKDVSPRVGASYDVFGDGRTAIKWNIGRYLELTGTGIAEVIHPMWVSGNIATGGQRSTRAWRDANGDFVPQEEELGPHSDPAFGSPTSLPIRYAPGAVEGWGTRGTNWEAMVGFQHELGGGLAMDASYNRRTVGNFRATDNLLVAPSDYDPFCVTAPTDPRLPGGGGYEVCGLYDISEAKFGRRDDLITAERPFGKRTQVYDGFDLTLSARLPGGARLQGGTSTGRTATNSCFVVDSPQQLLHCDVNPPMETQIKFSGFYPLPWWGVQVSATYQSYPGPQILANWTVTNAQIRGSLGRDLSGRRTSVTVPLVAPGTLFGERLHQVDMRFAKNVTVQRFRLQGSLDLYNLFNENTVLSVNNAFGNAWQRPLSILAGRLAKVGFQLSF